MFLQSNNKNINNNECNKSMNEADPKTKINRSMFRGNCPQSPFLVGVKTLPT
jgi:hypothetical protein